MNFLFTVFNELIFRPLLNLVVLTINALPINDLGVAIIVVTILIRVVFYPLTHKALKSQKELSKLQPEVKKIQDKYKKKNTKEDSAAKSKEVMDLYKKHKINPFAGCIPLLIQIPILIGLYRVFLIELTPERIREEGLYAFVGVPDTINTTFLGLVELTEPSLYFALLAGLSQFMLSKATFSKKKKLGVGSGNMADFQNMMGKQMTYVLPFVTMFIAYTFSAGLALYLFVTILFSFVQQYIINKQMD